MNKRTRLDWFYWFMAGYTLLHLAWMVVLLIDVFRHFLAPDPLLGSVAYRLFIVFVVTPLSLTVSILVLRRTPGNITGLCLLLWSVLNLGQAIPTSSSIYILNAAFNTGWTGLWLLGLFFPNGHAVPWRFERWIRLLSVFTICLVSGWIFFQPTINDFNAVDPSKKVIANPIFISALLPFQGAVNALEMTGLVAIVLLILPSLWLRYRSSSEKERLQIKWFFWTYGLLIASFLFYIPSGLISGDQYGLGIPGLVAVLIFSLYVSLAPYIAIGSAILLHRLYDIDIVIRRTLVYSLLTVMLGLVYFGVVTLLQNVFTAISGQTSPAALVISTLLIAALFSPLRKRLQNFIDRRFYRQKYDAQQALAQFAASARAETDLQVLSGKLVSVTQESLQPQVLNLWLKEKP